MIDNFKGLKGLSPPIMNEIFILRIILYTIRNPRSVLRAWIYNHKGSQLWQELSAKMKNLTILKLCKNPKSSLRVWKMWIERLGFK